MRVAVASHFACAELQWSAAWPSMCAFVPCGPAFSARPRSALARVARAYTSSPNCPAACAKMSCVSVHVPCRIAPRGKHSVNTSFCTQPLQCMCLWHRLCAAMGTFFAACACARADTPMIAIASPLSGSQGGVVILCHGGHRHLPWRLLPAVSAALRHQSWMFAIDAPYPWNICIVHRVHPCTKRPPSCDRYCSRHCIPDGRQGSPPPRACVRERLCCQRYLCVHQWQHLRLIHPGQWQRARRQRRSPHERAGAIGRW